jgi:hypothetical protein
MKPTELSGWVGWLAVGARSRAWGWGRQFGGRALTADGTEITRETEAEYDNRVMGIRLRGD